MRHNALALVVVGLLLAADEPGKGQVKNDPQASVEPRSGTGAGQKFLEKFVGDWDVKKSFLPRSGDPVTTTGRCRQSMVHGGRFLSSEFVFNTGATESTGTGLIGFEPATGRFTSVWTDSRQTRMSFRQGAGPFDGKAIVLHSRSLDPEAKDSRRSKTVTTLDDDGRRIVHRQFTVAADGAERLMMELIMTRRSGRSAATR